MIFFCFQEKVLKCSNNYRSAFMHYNAFMNALRYMGNFLRSIQVHFLKGRQNSLSEFESENCVKKRESLLVSKVEFNFN